MNTDRYTIDFYTRRRNILYDSMSGEKDLDLLLSFVWTYGEEGEQWREIPYTDSKYFVSNYARVISIKCNGYKLLKPYEIEHGYLGVDLRSNGQR